MVLNWLSWQEIEVNMQHVSREQQTASIKVSNMYIWTLKTQHFKQGFLGITTYVVLFTCNYRQDIISLLQLLRNEAIGVDQLGGVVAEDELLPLLSHLLS